MLFCDAHNLPLQMACFRDFGEYTSMQGKDYHIHQGPVPFSNREITNKDMELFKKESPLWAEKSLTFTHRNLQTTVTEVAQCSRCLLVQLISWTK